MIFSKSEGHSPNNHRVQILDVSIACRRAVMRGTSLLQLLLWRMFTPTALITSDECCFLVHCMPDQVIVHKTCLNDFVTISPVGSIDSIKHERISNFRITEIIILLER